MNNYPTTRMAVLGGTRWFNICLTAIALTALAGCGGGSGAATAQNPGGAPAPNTGYNGPAPATADVQAFKINLFDNVRVSNRCGGCHSVEGGQSPMFARGDDVNLAYADANGYVTLGSPPDSEMVSKVGGGHNCWLSSDAACSTILTTWITNWAGGALGGAGRKIELEPPVGHTSRSQAKAATTLTDGGALVRHHRLPARARPVLRRLSLDRLRRAAIAILRRGPRRRRRCTHHGIRGCKVENEFG